jgi:hypothetical protein
LAKKNKKMGAPVKHVDLDQLKTLMRLHPRLQDTAAFFEVSPDTIESRIKEHFGGITYSEFREQNMVHTRFSIIRKAISEAERGNTAMLIFCLKNLCGWRDRYEADVTHARKMFVVEMTDGSKIEMGSEIIDVKGENQNGEKDDKKD